MAKKKVEKQKYNWWRWQTKTIVSFMAILFMAYFLSNCLGTMNNVEFECATYEEIPKATFEITCMSKHCRTIQEICLDLEEYNKEFNDKIECANERTFVFGYKPVEVIEQGDCLEYKVVPKEE